VDHQVAVKPPKNASLKRKCIVSNAANSSLAYSRTANPVFKEVAIWIGYG
jgi:hypothetical protein